MIDHGRAYHYGVRVPDLDVAMAELGGALSLEWASVQVREQSLWTPATGATTVPLRFTYSCAGPMHTELLEGAPGSVWDGREQPGIHHVGVWVDDVAAETAQMLAAGWTIAAAGKPPEEGYGAFTYVVPPTAGLIVELVWSAIEPMFGRWWAGGDLA